MLSGGSEQLKGRGLSVLREEPEDRIALAEDERWALVQRIVASQCFIKAPQLRDILLYLTRRALEDNPSGISEHEVGCNVLGRRPDFNPNEDNIVRVQVRHLRKKLEDFYGAEGQDESILLTIPKGAYLPRFDPRPVPSAEASQENEGRPASPDREPAGAATTKAPARSKRPWLMVCAAGLSVLVVVLAAAAFVFWRQKEALLAQTSVVEDRIPPADDVFWAKFFAPGQPTNVVVADSCLVAIQDILNVDIPLKELYANSRMTKIVEEVQDRKLQSALELIARRQYTSLGDVNITARIIELAQRYKTTPKIRFSRYLDTRELMAGNFVLIGSRRGVPWIQLFEPQLNFYLEEDKTGSYRFLNRSPKAGEKTYYGGQADVSSADESYADIAILPNLTGGGYVLIISGITMEATEAAGALVTGKEFSASLAKMLKERHGDTSMPYVEILLQTKTMPGTAMVSKIICHRLLTPQKTEP
jgi:hypothetical protein